MFCNMLIKTVIMWTQVLHCFVRSDVCLLQAEASEPVPRQRRRKAAPERVPPMMSPIKSLYGRRTTAGIINIPSVSSCGFLPTSATPFLLPGKTRPPPSPTPHPPPPPRCFHLPHFLLPGQTQPQQCCSVTICSEARPPPPKPFPAPPQPPHPVHAPTHAPHLLLAGPQRSCLVICTSLAVRLMPKTFD